MVAVLKFTEARRASVKVNLEGSRELGPSAKVAPSRV
jgi:hypothetical protein